MKDIVITSQRIKKEGYILLGCFVFAFILNIAAVIIYKTPWIEIVTQIGYVAVITIFLYLFIAFIRFIVSLVRRLFRRQRD